MKGLPGDPVTNESGHYRCRGALWVERQGDAEKEGYLFEPAVPAVSER